MTAAAVNIHLPQSGHIVLRDVSYRLYKSMLAEIGDGGTRLNYSNGVLEIMSPLPIHERWKSLIGDVIRLIALERNIPCGALGSTTYSHDDLEKGLEPDECFYFANEPKVRDKDRIDLRSDPPPDLVIEIDITHRAVNREAIYAAMGVPEMWRFDGTRLHCLVLAEGRYKASDLSRSLPFLRPGELARFLPIARQDGDNAMLRAVRDWVRTLPA